MTEISTELIKQAIYQLCFNANTCLNEDIYLKLLNAYKNAANKEEKNILKSIIQNAQIAYEKKLPLCQDTGQVIVFLQIGQNIRLTGEYIETCINEAVEKCYMDNYFRKSVVYNAVFDRTNTKTNAPAIIYIKYIPEDEIRIKVLIKGAGSENKSGLKMLLPTANEEDIIQSVGNIILAAGENACPPMSIGIGIGGTAEKACLMSKEALLKENLSDDELTLGRKIKEYVNKNAPETYKSSYVLEVKVMTSATHIACMPAAVTINCHSERYSSCTIDKSGITIHHQIPFFIQLNNESENKKEINVKDTETIRALKQGEEFLLTGDIYVARDMAHKRINELIKENRKLPFDLENNIIFYAGPCPSGDDRVIGSIGPTTASRMDKYAVDFYNKGLLATIGKGARSKEVEKAIKQNGAKYFTITGGIAALLADKVKKSSIIAFEDLGTEAVYKIYVEKFPLKVTIA